MATGRLFWVTVGAIGVTNRILRSSTLPSGWSTTAILVAATCAGGIGPARAAIDLSAGAAIGVEHDSNPLGLSDRQAQDALARGYISSQGDTVKRLTANVAAETGANAPFHTQLYAKYSKVENVHFDTLDHTEYNGGGNLDWKPSQLLDASLQASQYRVPVELNDIGGQQVVQQTSRVAQGTLRLRPTPYWQISLTPRWYDTALPLPGADNFRLHESSGSLGLGYLGTGRLVPGLYVTELRGTYAGIENATRYQQRSVGFTLNYKVTDLSAFSLSAGHTQRTTHLIVPSVSLLALSLEGTQPAYTGALDYQRQLSVKTRIRIGVFRDFQQYVSGVNTKVGTGFTGDLNWATTAKLSVNISSQIVESTINSLQIAGALDERKDLERSYSLAVKYAATRRVSLRTYYTRYLRNSTDRYAVYARTIAGLELAVAVD